MFVKKQQRYLFLDKTVSGKYFSEIGCGAILKAISCEGKIAYINFSNHSKKLVNFFENICLSKEFIFEFKNFFWIVLF